ADIAEALRERLVRDVVQAHRRAEAAIVNQRGRDALEAARILEALVEGTGATGEQRRRRHGELASEPALYRVVASHDAGETHAPARVRPAVRGLAADDHEMPTLEGPGIEPVVPDELVGRQLGVLDVGVERAHAADHRVDRHGGIDDAW